MGHYAEFYDAEQQEIERGRIRWSEDRKTNGNAIGTVVPAGHSDIPDLTFNHYQYRARQTSVYPKERALEYLSCGLAGEVGELLSKIAKYYREDDPDKLNALLTVQSGLKSEIGDILWFLSELSNLLDTKFGCVAQDNLDKLADRRNRGVIKGKGDNR